MTQIITADIDVYDPSIPGVITLRYATQSYVTQPTDTPANTYYDGRIQQPANVQRSCFTRGTTFGKSQISFGDMVLINNDGALDALLNYSFIGRAITIRIGTILPNSGGIPTWVTVLKGTMEQAQVSWQKVTIRVRDRQQDLALPIQANRYAGTNSLPNGLEGVADIQGRAKPLVFGQVFNVPMPLVNSARLIYQLHDGSALQSIDAVYDRGAALSAGAAYTSQTDMETTAPTSGQYRAWNSAAGTFIRLASNPSGTVTADATQGATAAARTVAQLYNTILLKAGINSTDISAADITALDAKASYPTGIFTGHQHDSTTLELLDQLCGSVGAWFGVNATGSFRISRIELPTGTSAGTITATDVTTIERRSSNDGGAGIPAWKVKVAYQKNYTQQADLTAAVNVARKSILEQEFQRVEASDATIKTGTLTSPELDFPTCIVAQTDAITEAARLLTIYKTRRDMYDVTIRVDAALASLLDLGTTITLQLNRYGMAAGKKFLIIGIRTDMKGYRFGLTLWG